MRDTNQQVEVDADGVGHITDRTVRIHHRDTDSPETVEAIGEALRWGNRRERRRMFQAEEQIKKISRKERNSRAARRRVAKSTRKRNGKRK